MLIENAKKFIEETQANPQLQSQVNAVNWNSVETTRIAHDLGYQFAPDDLQAAMDELWGGELSEQQLSGIAGGGNGKNGNGNGRDGRGPVNPDTSRAGDAANGDDWSPPPGDVSGNSCFFGSVFGG
jgi:predicted ribosomally synthesized peptide with nif11-like leader